MTQLADDIQRAAEDQARVVRASHLTRPELISTLVPVNAKLATARDAFTRGAQRALADPQPPPRLHWLRRWRSARS